MLIERSRIAIDYNTGETSKEMWLYDDEECKYVEYLYELED